MNDGNKLVFVFLPGKQLQPSLMFVSKAKAYPSKTPFRFSLLGQASGLTHKRWPMLERPAMDKHSSLLRTFVIYGRKKFYNIDPRMQNVCLGNGNFKYK